MGKVLGYKIRHTKTGLYLSSIPNSKWTKVGKTWPRRGDVVRAINSGLKRLKKYSWKKDEYESALDDLAMWEVVELKEDSSFSALFLVDKLKT